MTSESQHSKGRRRRFRIVIVAASSVALLIVIVVALPRILRLPRLWKVTHNNALNAALNSTEVDFELAENPGGIEFNTGYSAFNLPMSPTNYSIAYGAIGLRGTSFYCLLINPYTDASDVYEAGFDVETGLTSVIDAGNTSSFPQIMSTFEFHLASLQVEPPMFLETLTMDKKDFDLRLAMLTTKALQKPFENGFSPFENEYIRGIIGYGTTDDPAEYHISLWDKHSALAQGTFIRCDTSEQALEIARMIAASYRFTIDELPTTEELSAMIGASIEPSEVSD